ncbi:Nramp family divalent metal transporter [Pseudonocardia acaciae]|uniref:Nramp family divalent metal transporter n=1 Tax=Pseudonocardia acaciae TaxID=551276 RepID=UPI00048AE39F|nr:Nramp family divalent metal transporter [Pseudonocardia acaciae]
MAENVAPTEWSAEVPSKNLPAMPYKEIPEPQSLRRVLGPSVIMAALAIGSGEFLLWPYITTQVGLVMLWAALVGVSLQFFMNMEIERWTLATGETAIAGFARLWKPWGAVMAVSAFVSIVWPGWATSGATVLGFIFGLSSSGATWVAIGVLVAIGLTLTISPVVYNAVEKIESVKVVAVVIFLVIVLAVGISARAWGDVGTVVTGFGTGLGKIPGGLDAALVLGAIAFAGAGGVGNLAQSNWIRDKGFGMGAHIPHIVSPVTGEDVAVAATGSMVRQDEKNLRRFWGWWRVANIEQAVTFWLVTALSIFVFSMLAYSTVFERRLPGEGNLTFIRGMSTAVSETVGGWFGTLFLVIGGLGLLLTAFANVDYVSRVIADVLKTLHLAESTRWTESRLYFAFVWAMVVIGIVILLAGFSQPLALLVVSSALSGVIMFVYSVLLIQLNRRALPATLKVRGVRLGLMIVAVLFYGYFSVRLAISYGAMLFG